MHATTEFDQLTVSLLWAANADDCRLEAESRERLEAEYEAFCDLLPEEFDPEEACLTGGDPYEQFAHDYVLTRMGAGVGFWETADWEAEAGEHLTALCRAQGTLEPMLVEEGLVALY